MNIIVCLVARLPLSSFRFAPAMGLRYLLLVFSLLAVSGCMQVDSVVRVRTDGSGIIREQVMMSGTVVTSLRQMMAQLGKLGGKQGAPVDEFNLLDLKQLKAKASTMGAGVYFISAKPIRDEFGEGYRAYYGFRDITQVRLNQNPGDKAPSGPGMQVEGAAKEKEYITFGFTPGSPAELIVKSPGSQTALSGMPDDDRVRPPSANASDPAVIAAAAQLKKVLTGMRVRVAIEPIGEIVETNATHLSAGAVILMELDFDKLLALPERFHEFAARKPKTLEDAKALLRNIPGIRVELNRQVHIRFVGANLQRI